MIRCHDARGVMEVTLPDGPGEAVEARVVTMYLTASGDVLAQEEEIVPLGGD